MSILYLALVSFFAWIISTLAGGGSPFVMIPLVNLMLGAEAVPPVITIGMFLGNSHRILLFWRFIDWKLTLWYFPGAIAGAFLGAYTFTQIHLEWLQLLIGVFLVISVIGFALESPKQKEPQTTESTKSSELGELKKTRFKLQAWHIMPASFLKAFVSGLIGTTGPVLNPFYLRYGLVKEELIATKATHVVIIHTVKIFTYGLLGALNTQEIYAGLAIGLAAIPANFVGKYLLERISSQLFRQFVLTSMIISGLYMFWEQRGFLSLG
ncbi:putative permease [Synechococcus sp. PCC 7502]|uniref:sulfite exporter TauE/SafE family protein n=1 Tax=Synechococcus sp. PCC 7502 TaxID=1173263 RepID=UPI00029FFE9F|nr:sulfite exporter TauE/SafE family protein [Synechococcus sp. PCC 7502]AFY73152.1 putative permease [Synechococcus sp. PCC 7502]